MAAFVYKAPAQPEEIKSVLQYFKLKPNTNVGQHFLIDPSVITASISAAQLSHHDIVVEIGPGLGVLTEQLTQNAGRVISIELDNRLRPILQALEAAHSNLETINQDFFKVNLAELGLRNAEYSVIANLPYQITSLCIKNLLTLEPWPKQMVLLVQREVAERIVAEPGQLSILGLSVQLYSHPTIIMDVPRGSFYPQPRVESAVLHIKDIRVATPHLHTNEALFFKLVKAGFAQKRKKLLNNLQSMPYNNKKIDAERLKILFSEMNISENVRAQELSLQQWLKMVDKIEYFVI